MKQTTLFGGLPASISTAGTLKHSNRGVLTPHMKHDVEFVYEEAEKTFALVRELLPDIKLELVTTEKRLWNYLESIKKTGVVALDTEVNGLNPRLDAIAGMSLYTPNESSIYVPINHDFYDYNLDVRPFLKKLTELIRAGKVRTIMHNSRFDTRVLFNYYRDWMPVFADTMVAAHLLNENEPKGLKYQWNKYLMNGRYTEMAYSDLFEKRKYGSFNPEKVFIYAALDTVMTLQLWGHQFKFLKPGGEFTRKYGLERVADWFWSSEMKVTDIAARMEERGIALDLKLNEELRHKYSRLIREKTAEVNKLTTELLAKVRHNIPIDDLLKLDTPISISSNSQVATLLYKGCGVELSPKLEKGIIAKRKKSLSRQGKTYEDGDANLEAVGKDSLKYIKGEYPQYAELIDLILEIRKLQKAEGTYLVGLRQEIDPISGLIHGGWNPIGTKTGRFSSSQPNLYTEVIKIIKLREPLARS